MPAATPQRVADTKLELLDLKTNESLMVPAEGFTFGREGGLSQISLRDPGVSKRHARVFKKNTAWYLEDLGSSNGTLVHDQPIQAPVKLTPGTVFAMSQQQFRVVGVVEPKKHPGPVTDPNGTYPEMEAADATVAPDPADDARPQEVPGKAKPITDDVKTPRPAAKKNSGVRAESSSGPAKHKSFVAPPVDADDDSDLEDIVQSKGVSYFLVMVPKAIAYYLVSVPKMLFNPLGTVRNGIQEQRHQAMGRMELIAYSLPAQILAAVVGFVCTLIVQLVTGTLSIGGIIPIVPLLVAVGVSIVTGYIWHPVLNWLVTKLKGQSDEKSRSNFFLMVQTATILTTIPSGIAMLMALIPLPFVGLIPIVLSLGATLITTFIAYSWFTYFNVVKWWRMLIAALGILACVGALFGALGTIVASVSGPSSTTVPDVARVNVEEGKAADQKAVEGTTAVNTGTEKATAAASKKAKEVETAIAQQKAALEKAQKAAAEKAGAAAAAANTDSAESAPTAQLPVASATGYKSWQAKREAIEKALTEDPTLLKRVPATTDLYRKLQLALSDAEQKHQDALRKEPGAVKLHEHLRDAEAYEKTASLVNELYGKLFKN